MAYLCLQIQMYNSTVSTSLLHKDEVHCAEFTSKLSTLTVYLPWLLYRLWRQKLLASDRSMWTISIFV